MVICDTCAFGKSDCILKPRVARKGGKECSMYSKKRRGSKKKPCRTTWPTSDGRLVVKIVHPDGKTTIRRRKV
jgi:hypothetical protein